MKMPILLTAGLILLTTGCDLTDKMDTMHDKTVEMAQRTSDLNEDTNIMYLQLRSKETQNTRKDALQDMNKAESFEQKVTFAGVYNKSFEYQLWTNRARKGDSHAQREHLTHEAVMEYFRMVRENLGHIKKPSKMSPASKKSASLNLYAMAVNLHQVHDNQRVLNEREGVKQITMLSIIKDALKRGKLLRNNTISTVDLSETEKEVLKFEKEAVFMLNSRFNMLPAMVVASVSNINQRSSILTLGVPTLVRKLKHLFFNWDSLYSEMNPVEQETMNIYLEEAIKTRDSMKKLGHEVTFDKKIKKILSNLSVDTSACDKCTFERNENIDRFISNIDNLLGR